MTLASHVMGELQKHVWRRKRDGKATAGIRLTKAQVAAVSVSIIPGDPAKVTRTALTAAATGNMTLLGLPVRLGTCLAVHA